MDDLLVPIRQGSPITTEEATRILDERRQIQAELEYLGKQKEQMALPIRNELRALAHLMRQVREKCRTYPEVLSFMPTLDWRGPADRGWDAVRAATRDQGLEVWNAEAEIRQLPADEVGRQHSIPHYEGRVKSPKRSTSKGDAKAKIVAGLTEHHGYSKGSCLDLNPTGERTLARKISVSTATVSEFFKDQFGGHANNMACCRDKDRLLASLKLLNQEITPRMAYGRTPPGEGARPDDD